MRYRAEIDGLRALAVVPVILYHAGFATLGGGYVGVDVFFVISGYLITTIIADEIDQGRFSLWHFYERRARRILPALLLVILTCLPFAWFWLMPRDLETFAYSIIAVLTFSSNFFFWSNTGYFETMAELQPLLHTWSLAVEEQYYVVFPLLMMLIWRRSVVPILVAMLIASLIFAELALAINPAGVFFLLPSRAWELLAGALVALWLRKTGQPPVHPAVGGALAMTGIALIAFAILAYSETTRFPGLSALPPVIGTAMVILFAREGSLAYRVLTLRPLVRTGLISYGAYLWHQPVFALFQHRFGSSAFADYVWPLIILSFALAYLGYRIVEQPFRRRLSVGTLAWSVASATTLAIGGAAVIYIQADARPQSVPSYRWALENADAGLLRYVERRDVRMGCGDEDRLGIQECGFGDPAATPTVVLWGDSLAGALLSGMDQIAQDAGRRGIAFLSDGCPPVPGLANAILQTCSGNTQDDILARIGALTGITDVVIAGNLAGAITGRKITIDGSETSYAAVRVKLSAAVAALRAKGARVILLEQGPTFPEDVSYTLLQNLRLGRLDALTVDRSAHVASLGQVRDLADLVDLYIETTDFFCGDTACPSVDEGGQLIIYDQTHVTREYSARLASFLARAAGF